MKKTKRSYNLRERTVDVMHLINSFRKRPNIKDEVEINMVDDSLQMVKKNTCGMFQLYFYVNLFNLLESSTIIHAEKLNTKTIEVLLNKMLSTNKEKNENKIEGFTHENNIILE